jgi:hypothetical protein
MEGAAVSAPGSACGRACSAARACAKTAGRAPPRRGVGPSRLAQPGAQGLQGPQGRLFVGAQGQLGGLRRAAHQFVVLGIAGQGQHLFGLAQAALVQQLVGQLLVAVLPQAQVVGLLLRGQGAQPGALALQRVEGPLAQQGGQARGAGLRGQLAQLLQGIDLAQPRRVARLAPGHRQGLGGAAQAGHRFVQPRAGLGAAQQQGLAVLVQPATGGHRGGVVLQGLGPRGPPGGGALRGQRLGPLRAQRPGLLHHGRIGGQAGLPGPLGHRVQPVQGQAVSPWAWARCASESSSQASCRGGRRPVCTRKRWLARRVL